MLVVEIFFKKKYMNLMYRYQHCSCIRTETLLDYRGVYKSNKNWRWPQLASHASGGHRPTITCMHPIAAAQQTRAFYFSSHLLKIDQASKAHVRYLVEF